MYIYIYPNDKLFGKSTQTNHQRLPYNSAQFFAWQTTKTRFWDIYIYKSNYIVCMVMIDISIFLFIIYWFPMYIHIYNI